MSKRGSGQTVRREFGFDYGQPVRIRRQFKSQFKIGIEIGRNQLIEPNRVQDASGDSGRKSIAGAGDERHARPKGIARGRMGITGQSVENEVGELKPAQMLDLRQILGENQTVRRDAAPQRLVLQISFDLVVLQKPKNAVRDLDQEATPDIEYLRCDLIGLVEAAKDKTILGQPDLGAGRRLSDPCPAAMGVIAMR